MENKRDTVHRILTNPDFTVGLLRRSLNGTTCLSAALLASVLLNGWLATRPPERQYFATSGFGEPIRMQPLTEPTVDLGALFDWTTETVRSVYEINFAKYQEAEQVARLRFLPTAWNTWWESFRASGNLQKIIDAKLTVIAVRQGTPIVKRQGILGGRQAWQLEYPLGLEYVNTNQPVRECLTISVTIVRTNDPQYPRGVAISQLIGTPRVGQC